MEEYTPILINSQIFKDPELSDEEKIIIALAQTYRVEIMYASKDKKKQIIESITASKFAAARGVSRDHLRRTLKKMQSNEAVKKYVTIYFVKRLPNTEDLIVFHFKDELPNEISLDNKTTKEIIQTQVEKYSWEEIELLKAYLKDSTTFYNFNPYELLEITGVDVNELVKGLIYTEMMQRRALKKGNKIKNVIGYLLSCFDQKGKFKYNDKHLSYLPKDYDATIDSPVEYEISANSLIEFDEALNNLFNNQVRIFYRKENSKVYIKRIMKAGRFLNPKTWLKKFDIDYQIVSNSIEEE